MKRSAVGTVVAVLLLVAVAGAASAAKEDAPRGKVEGTWEKSVPGRPEIRTIKVINRDHFVWVVYDTKTGAPFMLGGGTYRLDGDVYKEKVEFAQFGGPEPQQLVGQEQTFKVEIDGDRFIQTGTLSTGQPLREVLTRVKP